MSKSHAQVTHRADKSKASAPPTTKPATAKSTVATKPAKAATAKDGEVAKSESTVAAAAAATPKKAASPKKSTAASGGASASASSKKSEAKAAEGQVASTSSTLAPAAKAAPPAKAQPTSVKQPQNSVASSKSPAAPAVKPAQAPASKSAPLPKAANGPALVERDTDDDDDDANEPVRKLSLAYSQPAGQQVSGQVSTASGHAALEGPNRAFRDDPLLDKRIIEGMLDDKEGFLDDMHSEGFSRDAIIRRAAELGLSEALIRQVKGVAADLAGERPGKRPTPNSLGARTCLQCDRVFFSSGPGNRLCTRCRGGDAGLAQL